MRGFDPYRVGKLEADAWVAYYRRRWAAFLRAAVGLVRHSFGLNPLDTARGAWWVLRANQVWAPYPDNDPDAARDYMRRFYELVARRHAESFDTGRAAELELEWWRVHRELQHDRAEGDGAELAAALAALYAHVYQVPEATVAEAARERALAMLHSDRWVAEGCDPRSALIAKERAALIRSYSALLAAVRS